MAARQFNDRLILYGRRQINWSRGPGVDCASAGQNRAVSAPHAPLTRRSAPGPASD